MCIYLNEKQEKNNYHSHIKYIQNFYKMFTLIALCRLKKFEQKLK